MPTRLVSVVFDAADPPVLARFWAAALGYELTVEEPDEVEIEPPGGGVSLTFVPVPEPKSGKNRVHLDLASESAEHQAGEITRLRDLGATPVDIGQRDVPWVVLADPEGNELCVLEPRERYRGLTLAAVVLGALDPVALAPFWIAASGWERAYGEPGAVGLRAADGEGPYLELVRAADPKIGKNRVHLDVAPHVGDDHAGEVKRLRERGATEVDVGQRDVAWFVLADPEGNELCVLTPR